jgi:D-proline reductase (dithiol) PrdB
VSLTARHLEENGIPTVIMGSAKDIVEHCGVPRFVFSDFPLGNSAGKPNDPTSQAETLELALKVLESAPGPRTTVQSPQRWSDDPEWKLDYQNVERIPTDELQRLRSEFDRIKEVGQKVRDDTLAARKQ